MRSSGTTPIGRTPREWSRDEYRISDDPAALDVEMIWRFLRDSYWSPNIPRDVVQRAINGSMPFGLYRGSQQIGFGRVVTDRATFAYLADVFVLGEFRGQGLGRWLVQVIIEHPDLAGLRRWCLATRDAHGLYAQLGFTPLRDPSAFMERSRPNSYLQDAEGSV